jgi:hypothetical protein
LADIDIDEMIILKETLKVGCGTMDWVLLADDRVRCLYLVNTVICIVSEIQLTHDSGKKQKKLDKYPILCIQF